MERERVVSLVDISKIRATVEPTGWARFIALALNRIGALNLTVNITIVTNDDRGGI